MRITFIITLISLTSCISTNYGSSGSLTKFQNEFLKRVNKVRSSGCKCGKTSMPPVKPLTWNKMLEAAALKHARDMERRKYFAHTSPSGKTIRNRVEDAGYIFSGMRTFAVGENIAAGQASIEDVMKSWKRSEGHCKNIMNKDFKEIGAAESRLYWVQDFGMRVAR